MPQILPDCVSSPFLDELETRRSEIEKSLKANFESEVSNGRTLGGRFLYFNGWRSINVQSAFKSSVFAVMAHIFFGEMAIEPEFSAALSRYPRDVEFSASTKQYAPSIIAPAINFMMTRNESAKQTLARRLALAIDQSKTMEVPSVLKSFIASAKSKEGAGYPPAALADTILHLWINASHQALIMLVYTIFRACTRILEGEKMRREIGDQDQRTYESLNNLPLLHKFMMDAIKDNSIIQSSLTKLPLFPDPMDLSLTDAENGVLAGAAKLLSRSFMFSAAKIAVSYFLTSFNVRISEETALHLKDAMGRKIQASEIRVLVRDRNYIEENYL